VPANCTEYDHALDVVVGLLWSCLQSLNFRASSPNARGGYPASFMIMSEYSPSSVNKGATLSGFSCIGCVVVVTMREKELEEAYGLSLSRSS